MRAQRESTGTVDGYVEKCRDEPEVTEEKPKVHLVGPVVIKEHGKECHIWREECRDDADLPASEKCDNAGNFEYECQSDGDSGKGNSDCRGRFDLAGKHH